MESRKGKEWSDAELQVSVDAYLYLLKLEASGIPFSRVEQERLLSAGPLSGRNVASVGYRFRNISFVLVERRQISLEVYSPASNVGRNIKARINRLLDDREQVIQEVSMLTNSNTAIAPGLSETQDGLRQLRRQISDQVSSKNQPVGIGHNKPPEVIEDSHHVFEKALAAVSEIEEEVSSKLPNGKKIENLSNAVIALGVNFSVWAGQRLTDFSKATAVAAGTGTGLALSGLGEKIIATLKQVFTFLL